MRPSSCLVSKSHATSDQRSAMTLTHSHCATCGVIGAVVMPHVVLRALSLCHMWCHKCCYHAAFGVMGTVITPRLVLQTLSLRHVWCHSYCHCTCMVLWVLLLCTYGVAGTIVRLRNVVVMVTMPCAVSQLLLSCCVVLCHGGC